MLHTRRTPRSYYEHLSTYQKNQIKKALKATSSAPTHVFVTELKKQQKKYGISQETIRRVVTTS